MEPLADSFEPALSRPYREFFAWLISHVRRRPGFEQLDQALDFVGVLNTEQLLRRAEQALNTPAVAGVSRILIPSRVTLGADIAVVSVILQGLAQRFPSAAIAFVGGPKNLDLFAGTPWIEPIEAPYPRGGTLRQRLAVWPQLLQLAEAERAKAGDGGLLVVDPDSRMTQLGLLPLGPLPERRLCFDCRAFGEFTAKPLAELAADWLDATLGPTAATARPWTAFQPRKDGCGKSAAVSFGLGGNAAKRISGGFELDAVDLLARRGYRVILDRGFGDEEHERTEPIARRVEAAGGQVHEGAFRGFGEIVAAADLFVGYDSSFGHLAAAMGVPGVTVFAGAVSERMRQRWSPSGAGPSSVIDVSDGEPPARVLERLQAALP